MHLENSVRWKYICKYIQFQTKVFDSITSLLTIVLITRLSRLVLIIVNVVIFGPFL